MSKTNLNPSPVNKPAFALILLAILFVLVAGTNLSGAANGVEARFSLYKSTDGGASWMAAGQGLPPAARINALSTVGEVAVAGTDQGIFLSRNAGLKWQPTQKGVGTESRVLCFTPHDRRSFAGTQEHGVLVSDDAGMTWKTTNSGLTDLYVRSLLTVGTKLYAGTDRQGVFVSDNAGTSWTNQRTGLPESSQVFDMASVDGTVFAGLYSKGLYRWDAERGLWTKSGNVFPLEIVATGKTLVVGHNPGGVFVSEDHGATWLDGNVELPVNAPTWTLAADEERVFLGTSGKVGILSEEVSLFISKDRGASWNRSDTGLPPSGAAISFVVTKQYVLAGICLRKQ